MMNSVLDTPFETALRILLLMSESSAPLSSESLAVLDTLAVFKADENRFAIDEYDARREQIKEAVKILVRRGLIEVLKNADGFKYRATEIGGKVCGENESEYAAEYRKAAKAVINISKGKTEIEITNLLMRQNGG